MTSSVSITVRGSVQNAISRIVLPGGCAGPVSLGRMDIDLVVTEYGVADLRGRGHEARALALAAIAAPAHREGLILGWQTYSKKL